MKETYGIFWVALPTQVLVYEGKEGLSKIIDWPPKSARDLTGVGSRL